MTVCIPVLCPDCHKPNVIKHGKTRQNKQRVLLQKVLTDRKTLWATDFLDSNPKERMNKIFLS